MAVPTMPRSSSGEFQAVFRPCDCVNTPPSGGPTSCPKTSVTPRRSSPTCSASRIAWTSVATSVHPVLRAARTATLGARFALAARIARSVRVAFGVDVLVDLVAAGLRLFAHLLARLEELLRVLRSQLVHLGARHDATLLEL